MARIVRNRRDTGDFHYADNPRGSLYNDVRDRHVLGIARRQWHTKTRFTLNSTQAGFTIGVHPIAGRMIC